MKWTREKPKAPGWYWHKRLCVSTAKGQDRVSVCRILATTDGQLWVNSMGVMLRPLKETPGYWSTETIPKPKGGNP